MKNEKWKMKNGKWKMENLELTVIVNPTKINWNRIKTQNKFGIETQIENKVEYYK